MEHNTETDLGLGPPQHLRWRALLCCKNPTSVFTVTNNLVVKCNDLFGFFLDYKLRCILHDKNK